MPFLSVAILYNLGADHGVRRAKQIQIPAIDHAVLCDGFVSPTKNSFERHTAFGLPLSSFDQMFFLSRGDYARGTLEVRRNSVGQTGEVMVKVKYKDERLMESVRVCLVRERKGDDWRTGISLWVRSFYLLVLLYSSSTRNGKGADER